MSSEDLAYMTATEVLAGFRDKSLSPLEVLDAQIERIEELNGQLNCFTYTHFDRAREEAAKAERVYLNDPDSARPLEGVTCAIKDWHPVAGEITTFGSRVFKDFRPERSAPTVERLLDAGVIMHARTTTPEFAHSGDTQSPLWGTTRNPWNLKYSPGGSSGGAGAALASGFTTIADGTDGGGSVRIPASANGTFGYKAPFGRNPLDYEHPSESILHYGPLTRSVADGALMQNVMSGPHVADINSLRDSVVLPDRLEAPKKLRIAMSIDLGYFEVSDSVRANTLAAAEAFRELGYTVDEVDLGWDHDVAEAWLTVWESITWALTKDLYTRERYMLDPYVVSIMEAGRQRTIPEYYSVNTTRHQMWQILGGLLESSYDVFICPTLAIPAPVSGHRNDSPDFQINGKYVWPHLGWSLTYPFNLLSQCPVATVPTGLCPETGVPTGMQIVGNTYDDLAVFEAAAAFEAARPWRERRPVLPAAAAA